MDSHKREDIEKIATSQIEIKLPYFASWLSNPSDIGKFGLQLFFLQTNRERNSAAQYKT